jgi:Domain of unknown function (DUF4157)
MTFALLSRSRSKSQGSVEPVAKRTSVRGQRPGDLRSEFGKPFAQLPTTGLPTAPVIQAKRKIGEPNDKFAQEVDQVAELTENGGGSILPSAVAMRRGLNDPATPSVPWGSSQSARLQRKCACGGAAGMLGECEECSKKQRLGLQTKLKVNEPGDIYEREADRIADQVLATPAPHAVRAVPPRIQRFSGQSNGQADAAPASVDQALASPGRSLEPPLRQDMERRFGHDFSRVRVHSGAAAEQSAQDVNANAYTVGHDIVFGAGWFAPGTYEGRRLIAHELTHVVQQSGAEGSCISQSNEKYGLSPDTPLSAAKSGVVQRQSGGKTEADYQRLVKQGKWCRDSEKSGELHPGLQCYREIPPRRGYPAANQVCFDKKTGQFAEASPDFISAVSGQKKDGTCDIPLGITDPPHPFTQRGRRALGHLIADIATEDPDIIGQHFGRILGVEMGIALPKLSGRGSDLGRVAVPAILGFVAGQLGARGLPLLNSLAQKHGFLPTISLGAGSNAGLGVGVGFEKRDRPLPLVPVNTYLTFGFDSTLAVTDEPSANSTFLAKVGVRIDPGRQGGLFALGSVGTGLAVGSDVSGATSAELGAGFRATDFLDVQLVRETVSGGGDGGATYWLTLKLVAPQRVLKGHR